MRAATSLLVRTAPEPRLTTHDICDGQVPLPLSSLPYAAPPMAEPASAPSGDNDLRRRSTRFVQILVEVLAGERAVRQLAAWMSPSVYEQLSARLDLEAAAARRPQRRTARLASVHVARVADDAVEIAARLVHAGRSRALAVRLELAPDHRGDTAWMCTALVWA